MNTILKGKLVIRNYILKTIEIKSESYSIEIPLENNANI